MRSSLNGQRLPGVAEALVIGRRPVFEEYLPAETPLPVQDPEEGKGGTDVDYHHLPGNYMAIFTRNQR